MTRKKTKLVYLLAASHSGSTLLAMLLGTHPQVCTVGELRFNGFQKEQGYRCSCRALLEECTFWKRVSTAIAEDGIEFDVRRAGTDFTGDATPYVRKLLRPLHRGPAAEFVRDSLLALSPQWRDSLPRIQQRNAAAMRNILKCTGKDVLVDSSKSGMRLKYLLRNPELDIHVVWLVRDGREVALTYMDPARFADASDPTLRGGGSGGDRADERLNMRAAARDWRRSIEDAQEALQEVGPHRFMKVHYEQLCSNPSGILGTIFDFIGVEPADVVSNFRKVEQHVIGNGMRLDQDPNIRLDLRWPNVFTQAELTAFNEVAGPVNARMGYQ
jgi:hypothetical protein